jgi:plastocyanin
LFTLTLGLAAVAAACGGSDPIDFGLPEGASRIDQRSLRFQPNELTVDALATVYFTNSETALHTVTISGENESGEMERGDVFSFTFPGAGEYDITCDYHPQMRATITVR